MAHFNIAPTSWTESQPLACTHLNDILGSRLASPGKNSGLAGQYICTCSMLAYENVALRYPRWVGVGIKARSDRIGELVVACESDFSSASTRKYLAGNNFAVQTGSVPVYGAPLNMIGTNPRTSSPFFPTPVQFMRLVVTTCQRNRVRNLSKAQIWFL